MSQTNKSESDLDFWKKIPSRVQELLIRRGFAPSEKTREWIYPQLKNLADPFTLKGMNQGVERLVQAFISSEKICVYADFDLDGTSGLALLKAGLEGLGYRNLLWYQPRRLSEGYGFHSSAVEELHRLGVKVIVTVDVGITSHKAVEKARELGITVILTDHHLPAETLPRADVVINPNQGDCPSGLTYLCGAGVAFYLVRALKRAFFEREDLPKPDLDLRQLLDLFAIATLTDMVPLVGDNRILVKQGLTQLRQTSRPGLRALLDELELSQQALTSQDVGMKLAPKINALSRMETDLLPRDIYLASNEFEAKNLVSSVLRNNSDRVQKQSEAEGEALKLLENWSSPDFVFVVSQEFHRGVVGLVATKLAQKFNRPSFVGALTPEEGIVVGSARLPHPQGPSLVEALASAQEFLNRFGGHSAAAGFEFYDSHREKVQESLRLHFEALKQSPRPQKLEYDAVLKLNEVQNSLMEWHDFLGPYGAGFSVPLFRLEPTQILDVRQLRGQHLKLEVTSDHGERFRDLLFFSPPEDLAQKLIQDRPWVEMLVELQWNHFRGRRSLQMLVKSLKILEESNHEVKF